MDGAWRRPTDSSRSEGMPSLGEAPSGGARAFWLLCRFCKVTRRQGGTLSGRYLNNGYALDPSRQLYRLRSGAAIRQASSHILIDLHLIGLWRLSGRHGSKLPRHRPSATPKVVSIPMQLNQRRGVVDACHGPHDNARCLCGWRYVVMVGKWFFPSLGQKKAPRPNGPRG